MAIPGGCDALGRVMLVREEQPKNARSPMEVTLSGMVMLVRATQKVNAEAPMTLMPWGIV